MRRIETISHANVSDCEHPKGYPRFKIELILPAEDRLIKANRAKKPKEKKKKVVKEERILLSNLVTG